MTVRVDASIPTTGVDNWRTALPPYQLVGAGRVERSHPVLEWELERYRNNVWSVIYQGTDTGWEARLGAGTSLQLRVRGRTSEGWSQTRSASMVVPDCDTLPN